MKNQIFLSVALVLSFGLSLGWLAPSALATKPTLAPLYVEIIFDSSGSMKETLSGKAKIDIAREALGNTLSGLDGNTHVGFRAYGIEENDCKSSELLVDFAPNNKDEVVNVAGGLMPTGSTPIAYSVARAREDLEHKDGVRKIIVIGDGEETCGGDLEMEGQRLNGLDMTADSIFLGDNMKDAEDLQALAESSGGDFFQAGNAGELGNALGNALGAFPADFDLPPMDDMTAGSGGIEISEETLGAELENMFEENCKIPYKLGDQVLYEEYDLESVDDVKVETTGLEVILDVSGSMLGQVGGRAKIDVAREALGTALENLSVGVILGFRVYGHRIDKTDQANSCKDIELLVPLDGNGTVGGLKNIAAGLTPKGWTPIGASLEMSAKDLENFDHKVVLLLSDGEETCGGDPVGKMKALEAKGVQITVHTVGFDVDSVTAEQLRQISEATGGVYVDAGSADELKEGLKYVVDEATKEANDCPTLFTNPVKGGATMEEAVLIKEGAYTFDDFLDKGEFYYFKFPVKSGQLVSVHGLAARPSVVGNPVDGYTEQYGTMSNFDIEVLDENPDKRKNVKMGMHTAIPHKEASVAILQDGYMTLKIGNSLDPVHRDNIFSFEVKDFYDVGAGKDVSEENPGELSTPHLGESSGGLGLQDEVDTFVIPKAAKLSSSVTIVFDDPGFKAQADIYDENDKLIDRVTDFEKLVLKKPLQPGYKLKLTERATGQEVQYSGYSLMLGAVAADIYEGRPSTDLIPPGTDESDIISDPGPRRTFWDFFKSTGAIVLGGVLLLVVGFLLLRRK